jgi:hypothetical protein
MHLNSLQTDTEASKSRRRTRRLAWLGVGLLLVVGVAFAHYFLGLGTPELYESHSAPGKPTVEIRWTFGGFMGGGSAMDAYLVGGWHRKRILTMLDNIASHFDNTTNAVTRAYATCTTSALRPQIFQVAWSTDSQRVAVAYHGYFVGAYDRVTGKTLELKNYAGDYRRCDSEIEHFLQRQNGVDSR